MENAIITRNLIQKERNISDKYAYTLLNRLNKKNKIKNITKGKYTKNKNIWEIATNLFTPSYISFWSAAYFKGYTEQIINEIQIATTKKHKTIEFENYTITFNKLNKKRFFGFEKIRYGDNFIFVVDDEKLLIDLITKEKLVGNFEELTKIIKQTKINKKKIISYLKKINNKSLNKRIGYLLDKYKKIDLSNEIKYKDKNYIKLSFFLNEKKINKKWRVKI